MLGRRGTKHLGRRVRELGLRWLAGQGLTRNAERVRHSCCRRHSRSITEQGVFLSISAPLSSKDFREFAGLCNVDKNTVCADCGPLRLVWFAGESFFLRFHCTDRLRRMGWSPREEGAPGLNRSSRSVFVSGLPPNRPWGRTPGTSWWRKTVGDRCSDLR